MKTFDQLVEMTTQTLEPNVTFANGGYGDDVHHQLTPDFIELFSYLADHVFLPILTGCYSCVLYEIIKARGGNNVRLGTTNRLTDKDFKREKKEFIDNNVITTDELTKIKENSSTAANMLAMSPMDDTKEIEAKNALVQFLSSNGWPTKIAEQDAEKIIKKILEDSKTKD